MNQPKIILQLIYSKRLLVTTEELYVPGLKNPIAIHRDQNGIPYIETQTKTDAY